MKETGELDDKQVIENIIGGAGSSMTGTQLAADAASED
jgi:hypothetical protein